MKKLLCALTACALSVSTLCFAACGDKGVIKGNYEEKKYSEIASIIKEIDSDKLFDPQSSGIRVNGSFEGSFALGNLNADFSTDIDVKTREINGQVAGEGSVNAKLGYTRGGSESNYDLSSGIYLEDGVLYSTLTDNTKESDADSSSSDNETKIKIDVEELSSSLGVMGDIFSRLVDNYSTAFSLSSFVDFAGDNMMTYAADTSKGYKFKFTATEGSFWSILAMFTTKQIDKESVKFNTCNLELYYSINKDGKFDGASMIADIDATTQIDGESVSLVKFKGWLEQKPHGDTLDIPKTIRGDNSYLNYTDMLKLLLINADIPKSL